MFKIDGRAAELEHWGDQRRVFAAVAVVRGRDERIDGYLLSMRRKGRLPSTIRKHAQMLRSISAALNLLTVETEALELWLDARNLGSRGRYNWLCTLHRYFQWAIAHEIRADDPTVLIDRPRLRKGLPRPISEPDLAFAVSQADTLMSAWLHLAASAGFRVSDMAGLQHDAIVDYGDGPMLRVFGKGAKERLVPARPDVIEALRLHGIPRKGHMFTGPTGRPFSAGRISQKMAEYFANCGIDATAHQLRHRFGTRTLAACRDLRVVQELLGHADPSSTAIYTEVAVGRLVDAVKALPPLS